jgi:AraC family transcriptional regulator, regulatory protein of adaptative response / methylated-DNA-[protein]-cysteine methyltransferase
MDRQILFTTAPCVLGIALVARSARGVCAVLLGEHADRLERDLRQRFPQDSLRAAQAELEPVVTEVVRFLAAPRTHLDMPLDPRGSESEQRVWKALREIPPGRTESYSEVARRVSLTAQDVGEACAANALAVVIPCHRVVRKDGGLAGYRWSVWRKRALLERERAA